MPGDRAQRSTQQEHHGADAKPPLHDFDAEHDPAIARRLSVLDLHRAAAAQTKMAAPDEVEIGDLEINDKKHERVYVFNQGDTPAALTVQLQAPPALTVVSKPERLRPSREGFDPSAGIELSYRPTARAVDDGILAITLTWGDGTSELRRIKVRAAAHQRNEPTHAERAAEIAQAERDHEAKQQHDKISAAHERKVEEAERRPGGIQPPIQLAFQKLDNAADHLFGNQGLGVDVAHQKAAEYKNEQPPPAAPSLALQLAKVALSLASGRLPSLIEAGIDALAPSKTFKHREKETTAQAPPVVLGALKSAVGLALSKGQAALEAQIEQVAAAEKPPDDASANDRIPFFTNQRTALNDSIHQRKNYLVDIERALLPLNTPEHAGVAATILEGLATLFTTQAQRATAIQEYESTRQWARFLSHRSLGSLTAGAAQQAGLQPAKDGSPIARMDGALVDSATHAGLLDLEFAAELSHLNKPIAITKARLFGISEASLNVLKLDKLPLRSAGLPIRLRSSAASVPVAVTIARDEAGNVTFRDDSGAPGMQSAWLSRRGGASNDAAAHRAARDLIDSVLTKTTTQLGVEVETDHA